MKRVVLALVVAGACMVPMGSGARADGASSGDDGAPQRQQCTNDYGNALSRTHGRLDGILVSIVLPGSTKECNGDSHHLHLQVLADGSIYDVAVNVDDKYSSNGVYTDILDGALPGGAWSEGWHPNVDLDYSQTLGLTAQDFTEESVEQLTSDIESDLSQTNHISVFGTGYNGHGMDLIHYKGNGHDGAIVSAPLSGTAHLRVFHFADQTF